MSELHAAMALFAYHSHSMSARSYKTIESRIPSPAMTELRQYIRWNNSGWPIDLAYLLADSFRVIINDNQKELAKLFDRAKELDDPREVLQEAREIEIESRAAGYFLELITNG